MYHNDLRNLSYFLRQLIWIEQLKRQHSESCRSFLVWCFEICHFFLSRLWEDLWHEKVNLAPFLDLLWMFSALELFSQYIVHYGEEEERKKGRKKDLLKVKLFHVNVCVLCEVRPVTNYCCSIQSCSSTSLWLDSESIFVLFLSTVWFSSFLHVRN